jgi:hypothetical protein
MNRMEALGAISVFLREHGDKFAQLPRDATDRPDNTEIRKLLAVDAELSIALAGLLALIYMAVQHEVRSDVTAAFAGRN